MTTGRRAAGQRGFAMAALLVVLAVMGLLLSMALPVWRHAAQREREAELIFRGEQYARAIVLYQRQTPGAYPPDVDTLVAGRFLRRAYRDPMTADGEFRLILESELAQFAAAGGGAAGDASGPAGGGGPLRRRGDGDAGSGSGSGDRPFASGGDRAPGGVDGNIAGVVSRSGEVSIARYHGQSRYSDWVFLARNAEAGSTGGESGPTGATGDPGGPGAGGGLSGLRERLGGRGFRR